MTGGRTKQVREEAGGVCAAGNRNHRRRRSGARRSVNRGPVSAERDAAACGLAGAAGNRGSIAAVRLAATASGLAPAARCGRESTRRQRRQGSKGKERGETDSQKAADPAPKVPPFQHPLVTKITRPMARAGKQAGNKPHRGRIRIRCGDSISTMTVAPTENLA